MACGKLFELFCHRFFEENIKSITLELVSPFTATKMKTQHRQQNLSLFQDRNILTHWAEERQFYRYYKKQ